MEQKFFRLALFATVSLTSCWSAYAAPFPGPVLESVGCRGDVSKARAQVTPSAPGPLRLETFYCTNTPSPAASYSSLSPDGKAFFKYAEGLWLGSFKLGATPEKVTHKMTFGGFSEARFLPFAWSSDSRYIFGVRQQTMGPNGFGVGPLSTQSIHLDGSVAPLPPLAHASESLDGILWVGGAGLAVAEFGTKGGFNRPEKPDREPTFAFVDAKRGVILDSVALSAFTKAENPGTSHIYAQVDPTGRMHAVFSLYSFGQGESFEWIQGQLPKRLPYLLSHGTWFTLTPDSKHLLVQHNLSASGAICEGDVHCPRTPRHGTIADLREIETGRILWELTGTAADIAAGYKPTVSPDGRYAIVTLPSTDTRLMNSSGTLALISMKDGHIHQRFDGWDCNCAIAFSPDGRAVWISGASSVVTYRLHN